MLHVADFRSKSGLSGFLNKSEFVSETFDSFMKPLSEGSNPYFRDNYVIFFHPLAETSFGRGSGGAETRIVTELSLPYEKEKRCVHVFDNEWDDPVKRGIWKSVIKNKFGLNEKKIYARKCDIRNIKEYPPAFTREFFDLNHLQGNGLASVNSG
jgi:hypothetical protein